MAKDSLEVQLPNIDLQELEAKMATEQRKLLKLAMRKPKGRDRPDEAAASQLLLYFSREMIVDRHVQETLLDGMREVASYVVNETLLRQGGQPVTINPLMYFHGVDVDYKATKKNKKDKRIALAAAFNDPMLAGRSRGAPLMSTEELEYALTRKWTTNDVKDQKFGNPKHRKQWPSKRKDRPKTVKTVERMLIDYVQAKHAASSRENCRSYVHASFLTIAWHDDAEKPVLYPEGWDS